jgi:hypothetical protein
MKVKFIKEIVSSIGTFAVGHIRQIEDEHVLSNWAEQGFIELVEDVEEIVEKVEDIIEDVIEEIVEKPKRGKKVAGN